MLNIMIFCITDEKLDLKDTVKMVLKKMAQQLGLRLKK